MLYHIPIHIVNALFGIPLKRVEFNSVPKVIQVKKKIKSILAVRKSQNYDQLIQQLKQQMKKKQKNFQMETILYNIVMNLKWNQKLYEEIQYLKLFLLLSVFEQYFSEIVDPLIEQQEFQQFLKDFKAFFILNYFKKRILNEKEICQSSICHCIYMMRKYNLPEEYEKQYLKVLEIAEQSQNFSPLVEKTVTYYNSDQKEFDDKILRDTYFWKIKQYWINYKACLNDLESCSDQILNSKYGLLVCFSCKENAVSYFIVSGQTYETKYKTICQMFRDIKNRMKTNYLSQFSKNDNEEDDNENDGIFGDCCQRFNCGFYLRNYFCLYFLQGIIYTHILLRLFCFIYIAFYSFICLVIIFSSVFYILIQLIFAFFIYDFTNPSDEKFQKSLVYPKYFPILQILIFYPLLGLIKMVFTIFKSLFYYIAYFRISLRFFPIHLKNFVVFTFIKIFAQIPRRDSSFCKQITKTNQKNKNEQYVRREHFKVNCKLSIEQIKILIMQELNQTRAKSIQEKLGHIVEKKNAKSEKFIENLLKYSPFPNKSNKITELFSQKTTEFYSQIEEMFNQFYSQGFQIELSPNYQFFYDKSELELILGQIIDFLQQLSYQEQKLIDSAFQSLQINKNDYKSLCEYFIVQIFKDYVKSEKKNFESIFKALTSFPVFQEVKNYQISLYSINKYLEINFCKPFESIESFDLQIDNLLNEFQKWNSKNKYFK